MANFWQLQHYLVKTAGSRATSISGALQHHAVNGTYVRLDIMISREAITEFIRRKALLLLFLGCSLLLFPAVDWPPPGNKVSEQEKAFVARQRILQENSQRVSRSPPVVSPKYGLTTSSAYWQAAGGRSWSLENLTNSLFRSP